MICSTIVPNSLHVVLTIYVGHLEQVLTPRSLVQITASQSDHFWAKTEHLKCLGYPEYLAVFFLGVGRLVGTSRMCFDLMGAMMDT